MGKWAVLMDVGIARTAAEGQNTEATNSPWSSLASGLPRTEASVVAWKRRFLCASRPRSHAPLKNSPRASSRRRGCLSKRGRIGRTTLGVRAQPARQRFAHTEVLWPPVAALAVAVHEDDMHVLALGGDDRGDEGVGEFGRHGRRARPGDAETDGGSVALRDVLLSSPSRFAHQFVARLEANRRSKTS